MSDRSDHWLVRPETIRLLWIVGAVALTATVAVGIPVKLKAFFGVEGFFAFAALFGFFACVAMVVAAKALALLLKRKEGYYDE